MASIVGQSWSFVEGVSYTFTKDVEMAPGRVSAFVWLNNVSGKGLHHAGIVRFRRRLPDGSDQVIESGDYRNWPPAFGDPSVSSITFGLVLGLDQQARAMGLVDFWR